jgi:SAM-dependent methyltransferase
MAGAGLLTAGELAGRTGTAERYVAEWLPAMASGGYVEYDRESGRYFLTPEQVVAFADENSPAYMPGAFQAATAAIRSEARIAEAFRTGQGVGWHEHDPELYLGAERFYKPNYVSNLVSSWLPALAGVEQKLKQGARVADVGCGYGVSTILMAQAFPDSRFFGFDYHELSIQRARERAEEAGVSGQVSFEACSARDMPGNNYDLITMFDCLHDMGDPVGVARHMRKSISDDGTWMIVEPLAGDRVEDNFNPVGRLFYCASVLLCTSGAIAQEGQMVLGGQAGEARIREVVTAGEFTRFRRAVQTPINLVFEARP